MGKQPVARLLAEAGDIEHWPFAKAGGGADRVNAPEVAPEPLPRLAAIQLGARPPQSGYTAKR